MKFNVTGVKIVDGLTKKDETPFEIPAVLVSVPIKPGNFSKNYRVRGYGNEVAEIYLDPASLELFANVKFPADLELQTEMQVVRGKFESVVIGFTGQPSALAPVKSAANG